MLKYIIASKIKYCTVNKCEWYDVLAINPWEGYGNQSEKKNKVTSLKLHGTLKMSFVSCKSILQRFEIQQWMQSIAPNKLLVLPVLAEAFLLIVML